MDTCRAIRDIRQEGYDEGALMMLRNLVSNGTITVAEAASNARLTPEEFEEKVAAIQKR